MEQSDYLIETSAIIDYLGNKLHVSGMTFMSRIFDLRPCISVITKIELLSFSATVEHHSLLIEFVNDCIILELISPIIEQTIEIRKTYRAKLPDSIIAATARANKMILITRNVNDFIKIQGLELVIPHAIE